MEDESSGGLKWTPTARKRPLRLLSFICRLLLEEMKLSPNIRKGTKSLIHPMGKERGIQLNLELSGYLIKKRRTINSKK